MKLFTLMVGDIGSNCYIVPDGKPRRRGHRPRRGCGPVLSVWIKNGLRLTISC
jgi:hypothetical protein